MPSYHQLCQHWDKGTLTVKNQRFWFVALLLRPPATGNTSSVFSDVQAAPGCPWSWDSTVACLLRHSWGLSHASGMVIFKRTQQIVLTILTISLNPRVHPKPSITIFIFQIQKAANYIERNDISKLQISFFSWKGRSSLEKKKALTSIFSKGRKKRAF